MKFRKKGVIEAIQYLGVIEDIISFCGEAIISTGAGGEGQYISTFEGNDPFHYSDWIIKEGNGDFHFCNSINFERDYEKVDERSQKKATIPGPPDELSGDGVMVANKDALENITKSFEEK